MTLQASGAISLANVQTEFGGSNPIGINEYYGVAAGVPASGTISLNNFYGKSAAPAFGGWTLFLFGNSDFNSSSVSSNTFTGNTVTPGAANSPKTFLVNLSGDTAGGAGFPTMSVQYYQGGSLNTTWSLTASGSTYSYQTNNFTATFGASSIQFVSSATDPNSYDDQYATNQVLDGTTNFALLSHNVNLTGGGLYLDYDD